MRTDRRADSRTRSGDGQSAGVAPARGMRSERNYVIIVYNAIVYDNIVTAYYFVLYYII